MRIGAKKRPFYRVVAVDERRKRTGGYVELLGTYNPLTEPKEVLLKQDRIDEWLKKGAQLSEGFLRIIGKAPQRPPRKPKKARLPDRQEKKQVELVKEVVEAAELVSEPANLQPEPSQSAEQETSESSQKK